MKPKFKECLIETKGEKKNRQTSGQYKFIIYYIQTIQQYQYRYTHENGQLLIKMYCTWVLAFEAGLAHYGIWHHVHCQCPWLMRKFQSPKSRLYQCCYMPNIFWFRVELQLAIRLFNSNRYSEFQQLIWRDNSLSIEMTCSHPL